MRKKIKNILSVVLNIVTVISVNIYILINFWNLEEYLTIGSHDAVRTLGGRYHYWLIDTYGRHKAVEIMIKIQDFTFWLIEHKINLKFFVVITIMMIASLLIDKKVNQKLNKRLKVYFILSFIVMFAIAFWASPHYISAHNDL